MAKNLVSILKRGKDKALANARVLFSTPRTHEYTNREGELVIARPPKIALPASMCSKYARLAAEELFGKTVHRGNAWDLKYSNDFETAETNLENAKPGDLITFYRPGSPHNTQGEKNRDKEGNTRTATHAALLYDFDNEGTPIIMHQYVKAIEAAPLNFLEEIRGINPVEVIRTHYQ